uniref:Uncharacterized protein n=1 Tax=Anser cygnoides TaxID=8845 RepID=A0A8B9IK34_ANSCY
TGWDPRRSPFLPCLHVGPLWWGAVHERGRRRPPCWKHHLCFSFHQRESPSGMAPPLVSIRERSWTGKAVKVLPQKPTERQQGTSQAKSSRSDMVCSSL